MLEERRAYKWVVEAESEWGVREREKEKEAETRKRKKNEENGDQQETRERKNKYNNKWTRYSNRA